MRSILGKGLVGLAGAALLTAMTSALLASAPPAVPKGAALTGKVSSTEEGLMEGVVVSAKKEGTALLLSDLGNKFHEVLQVTRLLTIFNVYPTEDEAISSFGLTLRVAGS